MLFKLVKAGTRKMTSNTLFFRRPVTLFVMELKVPLRSRAAGVNMVQLRCRVRALKGRFCSNLAENMLQLPLTLTQLEIVRF